MPTGTGSRGPRGRSGDPEGGAVGDVSELRGLSLFDGCAPADLERVAAAVTGELLVAAGDPVCAEGDKADCWWVVVDGTADVTVSGLYVGTIGSGESIGELALLDGEPRGATVTASTDMVLREVRGDEFLDALLASPRLSLSMLRQVAGRLRAANERRPAPDAAGGPATAGRSGTAAATARRPPAAGGSLDPSVDGYYDDPYPHLAALREGAPVHWSDAFDSYVVLRHEDVLRLSRDKSLVGSITTTPEVVLAATDPSVPIRVPDKMMIRRDGADHTRLRRLVTKVFTPRAIERWRETAEQIVEQQLAQAAEQGEIDVVADFALPLPAQVISMMLGIPREDIPLLRGWSQVLVRNLEPTVTEEERADIERDGRAMVEYLGDLVVDKRAHPGSDILTDLILAEEAGDCLDDHEIQAQLLLLYIAGHETTVNLIANGLVALLANPAELDRLRTSPELDANAVEEVLRFDSPAQFSRRVTTEEVAVAGETIPAGSTVVLGLSSANRDSRKWGPGADALDVARAGANAHVSFGGGPHFCLGAALARLEGQIALPRLVRRFPTLELTAAPTWGRRSVLRGLQALPARVAP